MKQTLRNLSTDGNTPTSDGVTSSHPVTTTTIHGDNVAGDKFSGDKVLGDKITNEYHYYGERKIPRLLTSRPFYTDFFIGRDKDLAAIEAAYQKQQHLLMLVNGEGGMGKTTLAAQYWFQHEARYTHLAWMFADSGVGNALVSLAQVLGVTFNPQDDERAQIMRITEGVNQLSAPCLLVFDNANNDKDLDTHYVTLKKLTNCHILLTSRVTELADAPVHRVLHLEKADAMAVFKKHYPKYADTEGVLLDNLLHAVGFNTLVIELLAKNLTVFNKFQTQYSLASLVADLQNKGLFAVQNKAVKVVYQGDSLRNETPDRIIAAMYDLSALTDTEKYLLSNFAVLPAENIPYALLIKLLKPEAETLDDSLSSLQQKGWIEFYDDTTTFKISPVIQNITKLKNKEHLLNDCDTLIDTLLDKLDRDIIHEDNYKMSTVFSRYAETVVAAFDTPQYNTALLCERIGTYYTTIGNLDKAIVFYEKCSEISKELCVIQPDYEYNKNELAIAYEKLGETYTSLGNLDKALNFYEDETRLFEELYAAYSTNVDFKNGLAIAYSRLGEMHASLGNLDKALAFYEKDIELTKELYAEYPTNVDFKNGLAIAYQFLGNTHTSLGNLDKTLTFYEEYNHLEKELYAVYPTNVLFKNNLAISYLKLGNTHISLGNLDKALTFYEEYNRFEKELYAEYPTNVAFKNGLAISYEKLGETHTSLGNLDKALIFFEDETRLFEELYAAYSTNVAFKNGLAISYEKLGETHTSLGNLDRALIFFEDETRLFEELYAAYPTNVEFKLNLGWANQFLGITHTSLGNLDKALKFYEEMNKLFKELYAAYPTNVAFKNGLALSYQWIGWFYKNKKNDKQKAKEYYQASEKLLIELVTSFPLYVEFKNNLKWVQDSLKEME